MLANMALMTRLCSGCLFNPNLSFYDARITDDGMSSEIELSHQQKMHQPDKFRENRGLTSPRSRPTHSSYFHSGTDPITIIIYY